MRLSPLDPAYPAPLANLDPAPVLTVSGPLDTRARRVAIVGSREPIPEAVVFTRELAAALARAGAVVLSGGAVGVDATAHEAALAHGATWCVAPNGRGRPFPADNGPLFARIEASERSRMIWPFPDDQPKTTETPKTRNRVLVALAHAVVVVQAHAKSGSRNAARHARELGRPLFVVPAAPWSPGFHGSLLELSGASAARALCHPVQLFRFLGLPWPGPEKWPEASPVRKAFGRAAASADPALGWASEQPSLPNLTASAPPRRGRETAPLPSEESSILSALSVVPQHVDDLVAKTGLRTSSAVSALLTLNLKDVVVEGPDGYFRLREAP